jgi:hypothetical protein
MNRTSMWTTVTLAVLLSWAGTAGALDPGPKCEAGKNKEAGKYANCRHKAEAKAITTGLPADYSKCEEKFLTKWQSLEDKAGGACPDEPLDPNSVMHFITDQCEVVATGLAGGGGLPTCGDGAANLSSEECDGADLRGATCANLGCGSGTLACLGTCVYDRSGCSGCTVGGALPATGQTTCWQDGSPISCSGTGHDGEIQAGATLSYTDHGDGTVTDNVTGLMWEKKGDNEGLHDWDNYYSWSGYCSVSGVECWTNAQCGGNCDSPDGQGGDDTIFEWLAKVNAEGGTGFAGHNDWRIPNIKELQSIVNYETYSPAVSPAFNTSCAPGCAVTACSCTASYYYWSSTSIAGSPGVAWGVDFDDGFMSVFSKDGNGHVRAVRGGS